MTRKPDWAPRVHDQPVAVEAMGHEANKGTQRQETGRQGGPAVAGPRNREVCGG
jgi:hypothetical protein